LKELNNIADLIKEIYNDKNTPSASARRFPSRFIFLNNRKDYFEFKKFITEQVKNIIYLRNLISEDKWITRDTILAFLNNINQDTVIYDLSEIIRFFDKKSFNVILEGIALKEETTANFRIYIPMFGLKDRFLNIFWSNFYRNNAWAPVWNILGENEKICIYQLNFNLDANILEGIDYFIVSNTKQWFEVLDKAKENIISCSETLANFFNTFLPDKNFDHKLIENIKDYLKIILNKNIDVTYKKEEIEYWKKILSICSSNKDIKNFEELLSWIFDVKNIENCHIDKLIEFFLKEENDFKKWLLKKYITENSKFYSSSQYLRIVLEQLEGLSKVEFIKTLWFKAFQLSSDLKIWLERNSLLHFIHNKLKEDYEFIEINLNSILEALENEDFDEIKIKLSMITKSEKKFFIKKIIMAKDDEKIFNESEKIYPDLYYYINWNNLKIEGVENWVIDYFKAYNLSKIKNEKIKMIDLILNERNANKESFCNWYYKFNRPITKHENFVWIDGLGIEWLPLFIHYLNFYGDNFNVFVEQKAIARSKLPTITEINKWDNFEKINDLDDYCHKIHIFKYPDNIVEEIEIVKNIAKKLVEKVDDELYISADHGFTFLVNKKFDIAKIYNFDDTNHEGRCILDYKNDLNEDRYFTWDLEDQSNKKALIASKHYSLNKLPIREVHGGATPEEVLVPFIKLKKIKDKIQYIITPEKLEIDIRNPIFKIFIYPNPSTDVYLIISNKEYLLNKEENGYFAELKNINTGKHDCFIKIASQKIKYQFSVKSGFKELDLL